MKMLCEYLWLAFAVRSNTCMHTENESKICSPDTQNQITRTGSLFAALLSLPPNIGRWMVWCPCPCWTLTWSFPLLRPFVANWLWQLYTFGILLEKHCNIEHRTYGWYIRTTYWLVSSENFPIQSVSNFCKQKCSWWKMGSISPTGSRYTIRETSDYMSRKAVPGCSCCDLCHCKGTGNLKTTNWFTVQPRTSALLPITIALLLIRFELLVIAVGFISIFKCAYAILVCRRVHVVKFACFVFISMAKTVILIQLISTVSTINGIENYFLVWIMTLRAHHNIHHIHHWSSFIPAVIWIMNSKKISGKFEIHCWQWSGQRLHEPWTIAGWTI